MNIEKELSLCNKEHVIFIDRNQACICFNCVAHHKVYQDTIYDLVYSEKDIPCMSCGDTIKGTMDADYYNNH